MKTSGILKSGIWYTISNFLIRGISLITTPIFTRIMTLEEFGIYQNFISLQSMLSVIVTLNLEATLINAKYEFKKTYDEYLLSILSLSFISCIFFGVICLINKDFILSFFTLDCVYIVMMFITLMFRPAILIFQTREQYEFHYKQVILIGLITTIGNTIVSLIFALCMKDSLFGRILGNTISTLLIGIVIYIIFINKGKKIDFYYWKYATKIAIPYIPHLLSLSILNSIDKVMITKYCGANENALYSLAYSCGSLVTLLITSMNSAFKPWIAENINKENYNSIRQSSKIYISVFVYLSCGIMLIAPEVLFLLGGENYMEAKYVMPPIIMGCICQFMYTMLVNIEQIKKKTIGMALGSVLAAMVNIVLNAMFIKRSGYLAAAYTTLVGYLFLMIFHMLILHRIKMSMVVSYKFIIYIIIGAIAITIGVNYLYLNTTVRGFVLVLYIVGICLLLKNRKNIIKNIKS